MPVGAAVALSLVDDAALAAAAAAGRRSGPDDLERLWAGDEAASWPDHRGADTPVARVPWETVEELLDERWEPGDHATVLGTTGSGKSHLVGHLSALWPHFQVLTIDTKNGDECLEPLGQRCKSYPAPWFEREKVGTFLDRFNQEPVSRLFEDHYRLVVADPLRKVGGHHGLQEGREAVSQALRHAYREKDHLIVLDEIRDLTDRRPPGLNLGPLVDALYRRGRYRRVTVLGGSQAPRYLGTSAYDQPTWHWIGAITDGRVRDRLDEIGGDTQRIVRALRTLRKREFLLVHEGRDMIVTKAPAWRASTNPEAHRQRVRQALRGQATAPR